MMTNEELMEGLVRYGRWSVQDFVARSQGFYDALSYIRAERALEIVRMTSFVTSDSVNFLPKAAPCSDQTSSETPRCGEHKA